MWIGVVSLFPDMFKLITDYGVTGKAVRNGLLHLRCWNLRKYAKSVSCAVDSKPYGGGSGMLMMYQPLRDAIRNAKHVAEGEGVKDVKVIYLSPQGRTLNQDIVKELASHLNLILVCGRYKGVDERLITAEIDEELSIGDYVLSGGELAAMVLIDSISRLIPGVLGNAASVVEDSFSNGMLDCPHYTRPKILDGMLVPLILLSGNHNDIYQWRFFQSIIRTFIKRPDLLQRIKFTEIQKKLLNNIDLNRIFGDLK